MRSKKPKCTSLEIKLMSHVFDIHADGQRAIELKGYQVRLLNWSCWILHLNLSLEYVSLHWWKLLQCDIHPHCRLWRQWGRECRQVRLVISKQRRIQIWLVCEKTCSYSQQMLDVKQMRILLIQVVRGGWRSIRIQSQRPKATLDIRQSL
jgi:hypothetical protein